MKREYDFSDAQQGKFYRRGAVIQLPIYLEAKVQAQVERVDGHFELSLRR